MSLAPSGLTRSGTSPSPTRRRIPLSNALGQLKKEGKVNGRVAVIHVALEFGVEMHAAFLEQAKKDGLEVVLSKSYPLGSADLQPLIREAMAANPDALCA